MTTHKITLKPITEQKIFAVVADYNSKPCAYAFVLGSIITIKISNDIKIGEVYYGKLKFHKNAIPTLVDYTLLETKKKGERKKVRNVKGQKQSLYMGNDVFLCKCKNALYDDGFRAGTPAWNERIYEAAQLYASLNSTEIHISKDQSKWFK